MNVHHRLFLLVIALTLALSAISCDEDTNVPSGPVVIDTGTADFTRYVSLGNSITAGFQSNALSARDQEYSYPKIIAKHLGVTFEIPSILNPGIGGRIRLTALTPPTLANEPTVNPADPAVNLNGSLPRPYNNLGIPGAVIGDVMDTTGASSNFISKSIARANPFFGQILRSNQLGNSIYAQAKAQQPTFITLWIGNNDVLGYATSGGRSGSNIGVVGTPRTLPTEAAVVDQLFRTIIDSLRSTSAGIVVANIPNVNAIPFFRTVGPQIRPRLPRMRIFHPILNDSITVIVPLRYQRNGQTLGGPADTTTFGGAATDPYILLTGISATAFLGDTTGRYYRVNGITPGPGIDTTQPFGFHPQNPWPDALTLDSDEQQIANDAIENFNRSIDSIATNRGIGVVDINGIFNQIALNGLYNSEFGTFTEDFITGGLFSYDGVHPSSRGQAIIANEFIKVINQKFSAAIPLVSLGSVPGIPIGKSAVGTPPGRLDYSQVEWKEFLTIMSGQELSGRSR